VAVKGIFGYVLASNEKQTLKKNKGWWHAATLVIYFYKKKTNH
jgi:hypothetical protein